MKSHSAFLSEAKEIEMHSEEAVTCNGSANTSSAANRILNSAPCIIFPLLFAYRNFSYNVIKDVKTVTLI